jgi:copper oxidase (laccase) domain-containing protein
VLEATVAAMRTPAPGLRAWIGPAAGPQRYEVGADVYAAFVDPDPAAVVHFAPTRPGHWLADLPALARRRLARAGVREVFGGGVCTISDPLRWHSFRRDRASGRMASLIWINAAQRVGAHG